jgi:hypothetical protein
MPHRPHPTWRPGVRQGIFAGLRITLRARGRTAAVSIWFVALTVVAVYGAKGQASQGLLALLLAGLIAFFPAVGSRGKR